MNHLIDVHAVFEVCAIALVAGVGVVLLFTIGVIGLNMAAVDAPRARAGGRLLAGAALTTCAALVILGVMVMLNK